ncbi:MAG: type pilus assembly PilZ [Tardiphaga sp.]|nr:type pilus assembly PilZ [Tardiphaga sp.]
MVLIYHRGIIVPAAVQTFLKQRAVNIVVGGHYMLSNWLDPKGKRRHFACRTHRVSPFRMLVAGPVLGRVGDKVSSYFGDFGSLDGRIIDTVPGEFLLELSMNGAMRQKMADKLAWLERHLSDPTVEDIRTHARIIPATPHSTLTLADGSVHACFVIDVSVSGAAVSADLQPEIGTPLAVGGCVGRVVRHLSDGFAVKFVEEQNRADLERLIARAPVARGTAKAEPPAPA